MTQAPKFTTGILSDDLTSATDAAMAFLGKTARPLILRGVSDLPPDPVLAVDADSRSQDPATAADRMSRGITALSQRQILIKTVDSTLRGHLRVEIAAAFRASGRARLVIAPAFPTAGRITRGGRQFVAGTPVDKSTYALDPVHPARSSYIDELVDPGLGALRLLPATGGDPGSATVLIADAEDQAGLNRLVHNLAHDLGGPSQVLWVGSPGLAIALGQLLSRIPECAPLAATPARMLIVAGSANCVTHIQCDRLAETGVPVVTDLPEAPNSAVVCLAVPRRRQTIPPLARLVDQAAAALARGRFDGVIATGGETMAAILDRLEITRFHLDREIEPGFPAGTTVLAGRTLTLAMKAGGFGGPETLLQAVIALRAGKDPTDV